MQADRQSLSVLRQKGSCRKMLQQHWQHSLPTAWPWPPLPEHLAIGPHCYCAQCRTNPLTLQLITLPARKQEDSPPDCSTTFLLQTSNASLLKQPFLHRTSYQPRPPLLCVLLWEFQTSWCPILSEQPAALDL